MNRRLRWGVMLSAGLFASLGGVKEASACTPPPSGWFPTGITPTPANGVMLLGYACYLDCASPPAVGTFVLKDGSDQPVPGSVVFSQARELDMLIAFRPEPGAVTMGSSYSATLDGVPTLSGILVGPPVTWNDALTLTEQAFATDHPTGEPVCCTAPLDSCSNTPCFRPEVDRRTAVTVGWYDDPSIEQYQYVFRLGRDGVAPAGAWLWDGGDARFEMDPMQQSACYVLELKRLTDDSVQTFASRCVEQPDSFTPGVYATPDEDVAAVLQACEAPPDGYEELWCETRQEICDLNPDEPWCVDLAARCASVGAGGAAGSPSGGAPGDGGTAGRDGTAGRGGAAGRGGTNAGAGSGGRAGSSGAQGGSAGGNLTGGDASIPAGTGGTDDGAGGDGEAGESNAGKRVLTKGCGCTVPGNRTPEPASLALALALVALRLRRVAERRRHDAGASRRTRPSTSMREPGVPRLSGP